MQRLTYFSYSSPIVNGASAEGNSKVNLVFKIFFLNHLCLSKFSVVEYVGRENSTVQIVVVFFCHLHIFKLYRKSLGYTVVERDVTIGLAF